jgi:hypothetical protein
MAACCTMHPAVSIFNCWRLPSATLHEGCQHLQAQQKAASWTVAQEVEDCHRVLEEHLPREAAILVSDMLKESPVSLSQMTKRTRQRKPPCEIAGHHLSGA